MMAETYDPHAVSVSMGAPKHFKGEHDGYTGAVGDEFLRVGEVREMKTITDVTTEIRKWAEQAMAANPSGPRI